MITSCALLVDVPNLYRVALLKKQARVDYAKYMEWLKNNFDLRFAKAHCNQNNQNFRKLLNSIGLDVDVNRFAHSYALMLEALEIAPNHDTIIIGSSGYYVPLLASKLKAMGKKVVILSVEIPPRYRTFGDCYEIVDFLPIPAALTTTAIVPNGEEQEEEEPTE